MDLQVLVFPDIEFWLEKFRNRDGSIQEDIAGPNFLTLLYELRVVFLQDSVVLKRKYPDYYLWSCDLFQSDLYKQFEAQVISVVEEEESTVHSSQMLQRAMPELVSSMEAGFALMAASMKAMHVAHSSELLRLSKQWADFFDLGRAHFSSNESSSSMAIVPPTSSLSTTSGPQPTSATPTAATTAPIYTLSRKLVTVTDVWREYKQGLGGKPSVEHLETEYGTAWRKDRAESRFYSRRRELYVAIEKKAERKLLARRWPED